MNTLQIHAEEFEKGVVTESGYAAIDDAEGYGAASTVGAGSTCIEKLWLAFNQGKQLSLHSKHRETYQPITESELIAWCNTNFPACYGEYVRRSQG